MDSISPEPFFYELKLDNVILRTNNTPWTTVTFTMSTIGMAISSLALLLLILTAVLFVEWRSSYKNKLLIQFMIARYLYTFIRYLHDIQSTFDVLPFIYRLVTLNVLIIIYSEVTLITWLFLFSRQMYLSLVKVFNTHINIWKLSIFAWISPIFVSLLLYLIYYLKRDTKPIVYSSVIIGIKWPILITNAVLLILVLKSVLAANRNTKNNLKIIIVMLVMIFVFCFQQMFKDICMLIYVLMGEIDIVVLFFITGNLLTMYQCAFSILFWLFGNKNTRKLWTFQKKELVNKTDENARYSLQ